MEIIQNFSPGDFCYVASETTNLSATKTFYRNLFNWETQDLEADSQLTYTIFRTQAKQICLALDKSNWEPPIYGDGDDEGEFEDPLKALMWIPYISVEDFEGVTKKAEKLKAIFVGFRDFSHSGIMNTFQDPLKAVFRIWGPGKLVGSPLRDHHGAIAWRELHTPDIKASSQFYTKLFDWTVAEIPTSSSPYTVFKNGENNAAGIIHRPNIKTAQWLTYFQVDDLSATLEKVVSGLGKITQHGTRNALGQTAIVTDSLGLSFGLLQKDSAPSIIF